MYALPSSAPTRRVGEIPADTSSHDHNHIRVVWLFQPSGKSAESLKSMALIDRQFLETPCYGSQQMARHMRREGHKCGRRHAGSDFCIMTAHRPKLPLPNHHDCVPYRGWGGERSLCRGLYSDQGSQFTGSDFTYVLRGAIAGISMDGGAVAGSMIA